MRTLLALLGWKGSPRERVVAMVVWGLVLTVLLVSLGLLGRQGDSPDEDRRRPGFETSLDEARQVSGFVGSFGPRIEEAEKRLQAREAEFDDLRAKLKVQEAQLGALIEAVRSLAAAGGPRNPESTSAADQPARLQKFAVAQASEREAAARIPAGSFAEGTLLTGVYAPIDGSALPVQIRLDRVLVGPNRSRIPIQGAFLIGKAVGEANSRRAVIQVTKLSYVKADGRVVEVPVNGYVADDDGVQGLAGNYVWRIEEAAGIAATAGALSVAAESAASGEVTSQLGPLGGAPQIVTGDLGRMAALRGVSAAGQEIQKIVAKRLEDIAPAIHVPNGRRLTVLFLEGVDLPGVASSELASAQTRNPYEGLDLDR